MTLRAGTCLDPYKVAALIGQGGIGAVYRATDTDLKRGLCPLPSPHGGYGLARFGIEG